MPIHRLQADESLTFTRYAGLTSQLELFLRFLKLFLVVKCIEKFPRRFWRGNLMADQFRQARIGSQLLEIFQTLSAHRIQNHKTLNKSSLVKTAVSLFYVNLLLNCFWQTQRAERLNN